ncbi:hypothetical protein B0H13DRAFT_1881992 [Mycena leptocephala]|nr:hypothetical protein B0H13DRAFT_1881992 [Mycena leptocephala]
MTDASPPKSSADGYRDAIERGFHITFAASATKKTSHFSTLKTMKKWIVNIMIPYIKKKVIEEDPDLDEDQKAIIFYPVHTSEPFRAFDQLAAGITAENVVFLSSYPVLRNASVRPCVELYDWLSTPQGEDIIKQSWEKCVVPGKPEYNLSYKSLTSRATRKALHKYLKEDPTLANEIEDSPHPEGDLDTEVNHDDYDVPLTDVVHDALGTGSHMPATTVPVTMANDPEFEGLSATNIEEDIWALDDQGRKWTEIGAPVEEELDDAPMDTGEVDVLAIF